MAGQSEEQNTREPGQEGATNTIKKLAAHMYILHFVGDQRHLAKKDGGHHHLLRDQTEQGRSLHWFTRQLMPPRNYKLRPRTSIMMHDLLKRTILVVFFITQA